ncbi:hypothetical protein G7046_g4515 [Stylonectria norvegica]|nr:hypothetical protein G7046_g4515 [Stylonectria norvegica]
MPSHPLVLSPATPSELLSYIISHHKYPSTLIIGSTKQAFLGALINDVGSQLHQPGPPDSQQPNTTSPPPPNPLLKATLFQLAISRHIRIVFTPTVTHLRAYLSVFSAGASKVTAPPNHKAEATTPSLIVYGLLELHRGASEWSAQGIGNSAATFVDGAVRNAFRPVMMEPKGAGGHESFEQLIGETVPLLNSSAMKNTGSWSGRTVSIRRVLSRWFEFEPVEQDSRN